MIKTEYKLNSGPSDLRDRKLMLMIFFYKCFGFLRFFQAKLGRAGDQLGGNQDVEPCGEWVCLTSSVEIHMTEQDLLEIM